VQQEATVTVRGNTAQLQEQFVSVGSWNPVRASPSGNQADGESSGSQDLGPEGDQKLTDPEPMQGLEAQANHLGATMDPSISQRAEMMAGRRSISQRGPSLEAEVLADPSIYQQGGAMAGRRSISQRGPSLEAEVLADPSISAREAQANNLGATFATDSSQPAGTPPAPVPEQGNDRTPSRPSALNKRAASAVSKRVVISSPPTRHELHTAKHKKVTNLYNIELCAGSAGYSAK
jgi:hypothetical protein